MHSVVVPIIHLRKYDFDINNIDKLLAYIKEQENDDLISIKRAFNKFAYIFNYED